jgi:hypothetical protein
MFNQFIVNQKLRTIHETKFDWFDLSKNSNITWKIVKDNPDYSSSTRK